MATIAGPGKLGWKAEPFDLIGVDGRRHTLESVRGRNGVLVVFICNHCPYVKAVIDKYVLDDTQDIGRAYRAVCTPDFFGFNSRLELAYRGRLDASGRSSDPAAPRELYDAMVEVARTGRGPAVQNP